MMFDELNKLIELAYYCKYDETFSAMENFLKYIGEEKDWEVIGDGRIPRFELKLDSSYKRYICDEEDEDE